eukprot:3533188-Alexandrium_andersonii.AAC.1
MELVSPAAAAAACAEGRRRHRATCSDPATGMRTRATQAHPGLRMSCARLPYSCLLYTSDAADDM